MRSLEEGLSPEDYAAVKRCAARGRKQGVMLHGAIGQRLREEMWRSLGEGLDLETARVLMPILMSARRLEVLEDREAGRNSWPKHGVKEEQRAMRKLWGTLPEWHPGAEKNQKTAAKPSGETVGEPEGVEKRSQAQPSDAPGLEKIGESWEARAAAEPSEGGLPWIR